MSMENGYVQVDGRERRLGVLSCGTDWYAKKIVRLNLSLKSRSFEKAFNMVKTTSFLKRYETRGFNS